MLPTEVMFSSFFTSVSDTLSIEGLRSAGLYGHPGYKLGLNAGAGCLLKYLNNEFSIITTFEIKAVSNAGV